MNSDEERVLFEGCGWTYDYVGRRWVSPNGLVEVSIDVVVAATGEGPAGEDALRQLVRDNCADLPRPPE